MAVIGALQSTIIICGALLRPISIRPGAAHETDTNGSSPKELEALSTQVGTNQEDSLTNTTSHTQNTSLSLENELTRCSLSTGDSGAQSLMDGDICSPEEKTLLDKDATAEINQMFVENSMTEVKESETARKKNEVVDKRAMKNEEMKSGDEKLLTKKAKFLDFSILRECSFILYSMFGLFATMGFFAPPLYIIEMSVSRGVEREHAAYMLSTMAVAEILGRFAIGWIMTRKCLLRHKVLVLLACIVTMTADLVAFTLVDEFYGLAVCCALYGFLMGTISCTHIPMLAEDDVVGIERMSSAAGVYVFIHSFAGLAGPPLGGKRYLAVRKLLWFLFVITFILLILRIMCDLHIMFH